MTYKHFTEDESGIHVVEKEDIETSSAVLTNEKERAVYSKISEELSYYISDSRTSEPFYKELETLTSTDSIKNLMEGTLNLLNTLKDKEDTDNPVNTLVYLDKSARPAAYLLTVMTRRLKDHGLLKDFNLPEIKYMDIGTAGVAKNNYEGSQALLKDKFENYIASEGVLIVDDYVDTKRTIRSAIRTIGNTFDVKPEAIIQFQRAPAWSQDKLQGIQGITDREASSSVISELEDLGKMDATRIESLKALYEKYEENFVTFFNDATKLLYIETSNEQHLFEGLREHLEKKDMDKDDIQKVREIKAYFNENKLLMPKPENMIEFLKSAGGFLAKPIENEEQRANNKKYRQILDQMVRLYLYQRLVAEKQD